ncbi:hypothetical protein CYMTET_31941 [Cymbomonas tetramitiformis]|uniref:Uncharacterized protein n=1 Tax=Cymbomonas tetramitiformis TaxID=36881 RepID=A0AAE0FG04_9CHLO|nr:hypothetical protein CYMTET_31941 [Cymbomonas tetramitiformis]
MWGIPGDYEMPASSLGKQRESEKFSAEAYSFSVAPAAANLALDKNLAAEPGPGAYSFPSSMGAQKESTKPSAAAHTFEKEDRLETGKLTYAEYCTRPGPSSYVGPNDTAFGAQKDSQRWTSYAYSFGKGYDKNDPNRFDPQTQRFGDLTHFEITDGTAAKSGKVFGRRPGNHFRRLHAEPGPGTYERKEADLGRRGLVRHSAPTQPFSRSRRPGSAWGSSSGAATLTASVGARSSQHSGMHSSFQPAQRSRVRPRGGVLGGSRAAHQGLSAMNSLRYSAVDEEPMGGHLSAEVDVHDVLLGTMPGRASADSSLPFASVPAEQSPSPLQEPVARSEGPEEEQQPPPIFRHMLNGEVAVVKELLSQDSTLARCRDFEGNTLLHAACMVNLKKGVKLMLRNTDYSTTPHKPVFVNMQNHAGQTALHTCHIHGHSELASYLTTVGANSTLKDRHGKMCHEAHGREA